MSRFASAPWPLKAAYVGALGVLGIGSAVALTSLIALAGLHRISAHLNPAAIPAWFWYYRADPKVQRWLTMGMLASLGLTAFAAIGIARGLKPPLHGAARWAREHELRREGLRAKTGIMLGRHGGRPLIFGGPEHVMLYAPTRTGKGVGVVIPNLLTWPDFVVVLDIKRENWEATAGFRATHGQAVILFDPLEAEGRTARFNPLGHIDRSDPIGVLDELQKLSVMLFPTPPNTDPFWAELARTGFMGVGAYVAETPALSFSLGVIFRELTSGDPRTRLPGLVAARATSGQTPVSGVRQRFDRLLLRVGKYLRRDQADHHLAHEPLAEPPHLCGHRRQRLRPARSPPPADVALPVRFARQPGAHRPALQSPPAADGRPEHPGAPRGRQQRRAGAHAARRIRAARPRQCHRAGLLLRRGLWPSIATRPAEPSAVARRVWGRLG